MTKDTVPKVKLKTVAYSTFFVALFFVLGVGILAYFFEVENSVVRMTTRVVPYPAMRIGTDFISISEVEDGVGSIRNFYENQDFSQLGMRVDFSTPDGKRRLKIKEKQFLNKLVENHLIEKECSKRNIVFTKAMISQEVERKMNEYGSATELEKNLLKLYGWDIADFKEKIVRPDMYKQKLEENLKESDSSYGEAKAKIQKAKDELEKGKDFSQVAKEFSEGDSAKNGGELGWFYQGEMLPEISAAVSALRAGETTPIIESSLGYHIVRVEDIQSENENGEKRFLVRQVFLRAKTLADWLEEEIGKESTQIFLPGYVWNKESGQVEFEDEELRKFEEESNNNSDDISILF